MRSVLQRYYCIRYERVPDRKQRELRIENLKIARVEKNLDKLKAIYNLGVSDCTKKLDEIKKYLEQEKSEKVTL